MPFSTGQNRWNEYLSERAIPDEIAASRGYRVVYSGKAEKLGRDAASAYGFPQKSGGLLIPLFDLTGQPCGYQLRQDAEPKFRTPTGQFNRLTAHPAMVDKLRGHPEGIIITEGTTRVDALAGLGVPAVALNGVHGSRGKNVWGGLTKLPDFQDLAIKGNRFVLAPDGDVGSNPEVYREVEALGDYLRLKGANAISVLNLPDGQGLDDFIASRKAEGLENAAIQQAIVDARLPAGTLVDPVTMSLPIDWLAEDGFQPDDILRRMLRRFSDRLLIVRSPLGSYSAGVCTNSGVWQMHRSIPARLVADAAAAYAAEVMADPNATPKVVGAAAANAAAMRGSQRRDRVLDSLNVVCSGWDDPSAPFYATRPDALTWANAEDLDSNTQFLGSPGGVIDLNDGRLLDPGAGRATLTTLSIPDDYDSSAKSEAVDRLLGRMAVDERAWLLAALGYSLRGRVSRRIYLLLGDRGGGKSTLLSALVKSLGDYCVAVPPGALVQKGRYDGGGPQPELHGLTFARLAVYSEPSSTLDPVRLKSLSGDDVIGYRLMRSNDILKRRVTATMVLAANRESLPEFDLSDGAMEDRLRALPFRSIPEGQRDGKLGEKLDTKRARQTIVAMLVKAAAEHEEPPADTPSVEALREALLAESLGISGKWILAALVPDAGRNVTSAMVWDLARSMIGDDGAETVDGMVRTDLTAKVRSLHGLPLVAPARDRGGASGRGWKGWRLRTEQEIEAILEPAAAEPTESEKEDVMDEEMDLTIETAVGEEIDRGVTIEELRARFAATLDVIQVERERAGMRPLITWEEDDKLAVRIETPDDMTAAHRLGANASLDVRVYDNPGVCEVCGKESGHLYSQADGQPMACLDCNLPIDEV